MVLFPTTLFATGRATLFSSLVSCHTNYKLDLVNTTESGQAKVFKREEEKVMAGVFLMQ